MGEAAMKIVVLKSGITIESDLVGDETAALLRGQDEGGRPFALRLTVLEAQQIVRVAKQETSAWRRAFKRQAGGRR
jgi:hypothetical protein